MPWNTAIYFLYACRLTFRLYAKFVPYCSLLPCGTPCYSNSIQDKDLVNPYLLPIAPCYPMLLLKIDVIFDNIFPIIITIAHNTLFK